MKRLGLLVMATLFVATSALSNDDDEQISLVEEFYEFAQERDYSTRLDLYKQVYEKANRYTKYLILPEISTTALLAQELLAAGTYAKELLDKSELYPEDWNHGNAVHDAHMVLGMIAILKGEIDEARNHLSFACKTSSSPQLRSFGPNMILAKAMYMVGEHDHVVAYLQDCKHVWLSDKGKLDNWIASIEAGVAPTFHENIPEDSLHLYANLR